MSKLHLILAFHNHQPVGNFDHVLEDCYAKSYLPFLETLMAHPGLKVVLHYSGNLLTWIQKRHPEAIEYMRTLIREGRVEILSGGFYEPILSALPEDDREMQIIELSKFIKKHLGYEPEGMWLAERVWEPQMPRYISRSGIKYLPIDDYHFKLTGLQESDLLGYYITEDGGYTVNVFPGSEKLRYYIPFRTVEDTISYFREIYMRGDNPLLTMADDGEKFGVWPNTYKHCYEDNWLNNFFNAIESNSDWIKTTTFSEYYHEFQPVGRVYLPTASYREMGEWTLPPESGLEYEYILGELQRIVGEKAKQVIRGSIWRAFLSKYPESNHIHKRMYMISNKVHKAYEKNRKKGSVALKELWMAQCNDAYWHGIFGGLYLPHLRSALYRHMIKADTLAANILREDTKIVHSDFDCDGIEDIVVNTSKYAIVASAKGGSLTELSIRRSDVNIFDIISRRPEAYHSKLSRAGGHVSGQTKTIHDQLIVREEGLSDYLIYDSYRRTSLLDRFFNQDVRLEDIAFSRYEDAGDFVNSVYSLSISKNDGRNILKLFREGSVDNEKMKVTKHLYLTSDELIKARYKLEGNFSGLFAIEMNISLLGSPYCIIHVGDKTMQIKSMEEHHNIKDFSIEDKFLNLMLKFSFSEEIMLWHYPVETVSLSEQGVERLYQGTSFLFIIKDGIDGKRNFGFTLKFGEEL